MNFFVILAHCAKTISFWDLDTTHSLTTTQLMQDANKGGLNLFKNFYYIIYFFYYTELLNNFSFWKNELLLNPKFGFSGANFITKRNLLHYDYNAWHIQCNSSESRCLCLMKWPSEMFQTLHFLENERKHTHLFHIALFFPTMKCLFHYFIII